MHSLEISLILRREISWAHSSDVKKSFWKDITFAIACQFSNLASLKGFWRPVSFHSWPFWQKAILWPLERRHPSFYGKLLFISMAEANVLFEVLEGSALEHNRWKECQWVKDILMVTVVEKRDEERWRWRTYMVAHTTSGGGDECMVGHTTPTRLVVYPQ